MSTALAKDEEAQVDLLDSTGMRFVDGMDNVEYHNTKAVSKSTLDMVARDCHSVEWGKKCPVDEDKLKTFDFGDAMHAICLEPERLKSEFVVMPEINLRTNAGKEEKKEFEEEHKNSKILTADEHKKLCLMFESVMSHKCARRLIEAEGYAERSYFWRDERTDLEAKCRPDKHIFGESLLVDVKTTPDLKKFAYCVDDYRYYVQDPWYCDGVGRFFGEVRMEFLVIQKTIEIGRYPVAVIKLPIEAIEYGRATYKENLMKYAQFLSSDQNTEAQELHMHYRFMENAMQAITEVQI